MLIEMLAVLLSMLVLALLAGWFGLPLLRRLNVGQNVRDDGPASHLKKSGTPTFGGLFFLVPLVLLGVYAVFGDPRLRTLAVLILLMLTYALVGFIDDYIKVRISKKGLSVKQKTILLGLFSLLFTVYYLWLAPEQPFFLMPVTGSVLTITGWFKIPYGILVVLYLFFVCNAVNLTDGVDGLASSVTIVCSAALGAAGLLLQGSLPSARPAAWLSAALLGGCLGFLVFNRHPAKVFMGDTGSQALGAGVAAIALLYGAPWLMLLMGIIYMVEAFSVIIQVAYFKKTGGKRIFRMSPIHHHYELGGWSENKIVITFSLVTLAGSLIGLLLLL
jgi:phospho-N-acetylmuramoyl-pentapeptide-transferase